MESSDLHLARDHAAAWARQAGDLAWRRFGSRLSVSRKQDRSLLTEVDLEAQELILGLIGRQYPDHDVMGEEGFTQAGPPHRGRRFTWIIDPLDGTRNYAHGLPCFSISIGLLDGFRPVVGVVYEPAGQRLFEAVAGGGARLGDRPLAVARSDERLDTLIGFPGGRNLRVPGGIFEVLGEQANLRNLGSTCLHLAWVAAGALDAAYARRAKLWDVAAGAVLVQEAGGRISAPNGRPLFAGAPALYEGDDMPFIAGSPALHERLVQAMQLAGF